MESAKVLIKIDRNGTKYWSITETCPRCGGIGDYIKGINFGTCFCCHGTGKHNYTYKEFTPEHEAKLEARRQARMEKKAEANKEMSSQILIRRYADLGCGPDGIGYILTGKTYSAKEEIKQNGGRWIFGAWVCPVEIKAKGIEAKAINLNGHVGSGSEMWLDGFDMYKEIHG